MRKRRGPAPKDMTGFISGKLKVLGLDESKHGHGAYWTSACECGNVVSVRGDALRTGQTRSCGCLAAEIAAGVAAASFTKHGQNRGRNPSAIYRAWNAMKNRCDNPKNAAYASYGGRGIAYTPAWASFDQFAADMAAGWARGLSLDRIDNSKGYSKDNCRWATRTEQNRNTRGNVWYDTPQGRVLQVDAARQLGVTGWALRKRKNLPEGWSRVQ